MSIHWSDLRALVHAYQLKRLQLFSVFFAITLSLASTQLRTLFILAFFTLLSYLFQMATLLNAMAESILQYILGFGAWYGLGTLGEPPLTTSQPWDKGGFCLPNQRGEKRSSQDPMPAWLIVLFFALVSARYIFSFLFAYLFQVISTVVMVSSEDVTVLAAARADRHPAAKVYPETKRINRPLARTGTFQPKFLRKGKRSFTRSVTMPIESLGRKFFGLACLRGLNAYLILSVAQWYLGAFADLLLSGQPKEMMPGYGSTSVILAIFFGGGSALWTHYAITEPTNREIHHLFPQGSEILVELFPITCLWAVCEQITMSIPLALSRTQSFELRQYAWDPSSWNQLNGPNQRLLLFKFALVYLLYLVLVATISIPSTMMLRRIHASMLPEEGEAIVPYTRGNPQPRHDPSTTTTTTTTNNNNIDINDNEGGGENTPTLSPAPAITTTLTASITNRNRSPNPTHRPGLSVSEAWSTLTWPAYFRVLSLFLQYFLINQLIHLACWEAEWRLHSFFHTAQYTSPFPGAGAGAGAMTGRLALKIWE